MSKRNFYFETGYPYFSATSVFRTPPAGNVHAQAARSCPPSPGIGYYIEWYMTLIGHITMLLILIKNT